MIVLDRKTFFDHLRESKTFGGELTKSQVMGMNALLDVWEARYVMRTPPTQFAYMLGTTAWETGRTMQPIKEHGGEAYFFRMYDPRGQRPKVAARLGNTQPGDGAKFCGRGNVQITGRANYAKATKKLRELGVIDESADFVQKPDLVMRPEYAAPILFEGMEGGWFTGISLDKTIDPLDDAGDDDEFRDYVKSRAIINGTDKAKDVAAMAMDFLHAIKVGIEAQLAQPAPQPAATMTVQAESFEVATPKPPAPSGVDPRKLPAFRREGIQRRLRELGFYSTGFVDGQWGDSSVGALASFKERAKLPITDLIDDATEAALADDKNRKVPSEARQKIKEEDLRAAGSRTITHSDKVQVPSAATGFGSLMVLAIGGITEFFGSAREMIQPLLDMIGLVPWYVPVLLVLAVSLWMAHQAQQVKNARVEDARTGRHFGIGDPPPNPPISVGRSTDGPLEAA